MSAEQPVTGLAIFDGAVARAPQRPAICYAGMTLDYREVNALSDAFATSLREAGFTPGDRLAIFLQNMPSFVIAVLAAWKLGGIAVPVNPMNREREVAAILSDCRPKALVCLDELYDTVISPLDPSLIPATVYRVNASELRSPTMTPAAATSAPLSRAAIGASDIALLVYTSGTTGTSKGAMITHAAYAFNSNSFCQVARLMQGEPILGIAPLFHITGIVACLGSAWRMAAPLVLIYRFDADIVLQAIDTWQPAFVVAAITAFIAIFNHAGATRERLACLKRVYSGGAPVPAGFVSQFEERFGHYIHNCYGLTETAAPTHIVPFGLRAPINPAGGELSIGVPVPGAQAHLVDDGGSAAADGGPGELVIRGPMVSPGYWQNPAETATAMRADGFHTGDVAIRDVAGWFYLVDRKKDVIISSGYKVWPREVEDVLYTHSAVREAAVVGAADDYRGEAVKAFVSLKPGMSAAPEELAEFCRARLAAYKYPRSVVILSELPKTATGKILRRQLRQPGS